MAYTPFHADWKDSPDPTTPITAAALEYIETGITAAALVADNAIPKSLADAKGDLLIATGADTFARKAVGANDTVPVAASADGSGVVWQQVGNAQIATGAAVAVSKLAAGAADQVLKTVGGVPTWFGSFTAYTPTWGATGTAPALGNGTITGRHLQIGKHVYVHIELTAGSTTTFGTGTWTFTLPFTASAFLATGTAAAFDTSAGQLFFGFSRWNSTTTINVFSPAAPGVAWTVTTPFAWASTDTVAIDFHYEAA